MQSPLRTISSTATDFANFQSTVSSCVIFCEADNRLLFLRNNAESQAGKWALPGGNVRNDETPIAAALRLFSEQTPIKLNADQSFIYTQRFARIEGIDSIIHFFQLNFDKKPQEASDLQWISIFALPILDQIQNLEVPGRADAFDVIYRDRFWQRIEGRSVEPKSLCTAAQFVFMKQDQRLEFDPTRKLIITVLGTAGSGKNTQAQLLEWALGMTSTSDGEIMQNEIDTPLSKMVAAFDENPKCQGLELPSELHLGMMARRLSQPDCSSGYILRGFPSSETQCDTLLSIFVRHTDFLLPIHLDIPDEDVKSRISDEGTTGELRLAHFKRTKDGILQKLATRSVIQTLPLSGAIPQLEVYHLVCCAVQGKFDELAQQQSEMQRRMPANDELVQRVAKHSPTSSKSRPLIFFGSVAAIACFGYYWIKRNS